MSRPYVLLSVATSLDGYIDDARPERLLLSNDEDFDRVDAVRAGVDAILVGPGTIGADNPRLLVRSAARRAERVEKGEPESPIKITLSRGGRSLDPQSRFFTAGRSDKLVYTSSGAHEDLRSRLGRVATVLDAGDPLQLDAVLADLAARRISRLLVEGGTTMNTLFLTAGVVDELQVAVAPFFVGDPAAPRIVDPGTYPQDPAHHMRVVAVRQIGDVVLMVYRPQGTRSAREGRGC